MGTNGDCGNELELWEAIQCRMYLSLRRRSTTSQTFSQTMCTVEDPDD